MRFTSKFKNSFSINLNILECKSIKSAFCTNSISVLILTYWNVNELSFEVDNEIRKSINLNILECKYVKINTGTELVQY